jgi:hypothetical protein
MIYPDAHITLTTIHAAPSGSAHPPVFRCRFPPLTLPPPVPPRRSDLRTSADGTYADVCLPLGWEERCTPDRRHAHNNLERPSTDLGIGLEATTTLANRAALGPLLYGWEMPMTPPRRIYFVDHNTCTITRDDLRRQQCTNTLHKRLTESSSFNMYCLNELLHSISHYTSDHLEQWIGVVDLSRCQYK